LEEQKTASIKKTAYFIEIDILRKNLTGNIAGGRVQRLVLLLVDIVSHAVSIG
jgi:hypothetical protein